MLILNKNDIIQHVDLNKNLIPIIEEAFISLSKGLVMMPPIMRIDIEKFHGESDVKAAYIDGLDSFAIKIASGFFDNPKLGLPSSNGLMVLLDSETGVIKSVLLDEGYLTDTRTAIAGAIASKYLSNQDANTVGIIGAGIQARLQLKAILLVRKINKINLWARDKIKVDEIPENLVEEEVKILSQGVSEEEAKKNKKDFEEKAKNRSVRTGTFRMVPEGSYLAAPGASRRSCLH